MVLPIYHNLPVLVYFILSVSALRSREAESRPIHTDDSYCLIITVTVLLSLLLCYYHCYCVIITVTVLLSLLLCYYD